MKNVLNRLFANDILTPEETKQLLLGIIEGKYSDVQIGALLTAYRMRPITAGELIGFREALMTTRVPVDLAAYHPIDLVGTGGDGKNTFNISTCACFLVAAAGYPVAKHGNYGASSVSGASNVLEQHGVKFTNDPDHLVRSMEATGVVYLHAPLFNPAMKSVATARKQLQVRTLFNLLGPLVNPACPPFQLLGVADLSQMRLYRTVLQKLGIGFTIVNSFDGYDEISLTGSFKVAANHYESIFTPASLGLPAVRPEELHGGTTPQEAATLFDSVLENTAPPARAACVVANAAFAIQTAEPGKRVEECLAIAREALESGKALATFRKFIEING